MNKYLMTAAAVILSGMLYSAWTQEIEYGRTLEQATPEQLEKVHELEQKGFEYRQVISPKTAPQYKDGVRTFRVDLDSIFMYDPKEPDRRALKILTNGHVIYMLSGSRPPESQ
jgi:hypothetical protein